MSEPFVCHAEEFPEKPLVSVVTVCLNSEKFIEIAIQSVLNQTYDNIEYIIIDGGSTDNTLKIIEKYKKHLALLESGPDRGIYDAMNKGIRHCNGELIGLLNSDDWYESHTAEWVVAAWLSFNKPDIVHGSKMVWSQDGKPICYVSPKEDFGTETPFKHPACFVTRSLYEQIGYYRADFRVAADYDFMLRALKNGSQSYYISKVLTNCRQGGFTSQGSFSLRTKEKMQAIIQNDFGLVLAFRVAAKMGFLALKRRLKNLQESGPFETEKDSKFE